MKETTMNKFSVGLGLFDYINPILYTVTAITLLKNLHGVMNKTLYGFLLVGAIISIVFGFVIPTIKLLVGLGKMEFSMPTLFVLLVNTGLVISGVGIFSHVVFDNAALGIVLLIALLDCLAMFLYKKQNYNTMAVAIGAIGYGLIYLGLIKLALNSGLILNVVLYGLAICLYVFLILIGTKSDLNKPRVHWTIEISNVICQLLVAVSTVLLFVA